MLIKVKVRGNVGARIVCVVSVFFMILDADWKGGKMIISCVKG